LACFTTFVWTDKKVKRSEKAGGRLKEERLFFSSEAIEARMRLSDKPEIGNDQMRGVAKKCTQQTEEM